MELGGASQGLARADVAGALLGVVDDDDGDGVAALQLAQIGEQRRPGVPQQGRRLRPVVQDRGRDADDDCRRPQASRRAHRPHRRSPHLGFGADPSSACPRHRSRRRPVAGRRALDRLQAGFFLPVRVLSRLFRRLFLEGLAALNQAGRLAFFGDLAPLADNRPPEWRRWAAVTAFALAGCNVNRTCFANIGPPIMVLGCASK